MTYQHAPLEEWAPHQSYAMRPLRPSVLAGVSARRWLGEWKEPNQACMQWWKVRASVFKCRERSSVRAPRLSRDPCPSCCVRVRSGAN